MFYLYGRFEHNVRPEGVFCQIKFRRNPPSCPVAAAESLYFNPWPVSERDSRDCAGSGCGKQGLVTTPPTAPPLSGAR